ncbi:DUF4365 domain-containing protein [uncultured Bradyrhizobium sp.]|uniref:DUF4365 domain-containing protein n=1 Tax=uncultured Bradyrhizobium sp. TaxID=199684 RepID=UPI00345B8EE9
MPLPREHLLDELATAYVQTIAAAAGAVIAVGRDYGVDGTLNRIVQVRTAHRTRFVPSGFPVEFQLKGTTTASIRGDRVHYDLQARNYDLIVGRHRQAVPCCLFLICFENEPESWFALQPRELILKASAFWWRETGSTTSNSGTVRISVPLENRLTPGAIELMLQASKERFEE